MEDITASGARSSWTAERRFFTGMAIAMLLVAYVGFARSFFLRPLFPEWPSPSEPIFYVHGAFFSAWCVLLVAQAMLVGIGRTDVHRKLGVFGVVVAAGMVILGVAGALIAANRPTGFHGVPVPPLQFLVVPLFDIAFFITFFGLGVANRTTPQSHKRYMMLATVTLLAAAFARWPYVWKLGNPFAYFGLSDLFIVALAIWDFRTRGKLHPVTRWGGLALIVSQPARLALSGTAVWLAFATWLTNLAR
ncbi:MAG: hypothetical protein WBM03_07565 [Steroidobacteraceae bacterium]